VKELDQALFILNNEIDKKKQLHLKLKNSVAQKKLELSSNIEEQRAIITKKLE